MFYGHWRIPIVHLPLLLHSVMLVASSTLCTPVTHVASRAAPKVRKWLAKRGWKKSTAGGRIQVPKREIENIRYACVDTGMLNLSLDFMMDNGFLVFADNIDSEFQRVIFTNFVRV